MRAEALAEAWLSGERLSAWRAPDAERGVLDLSRSSLHGQLLLRWELVRGVPEDQAAQAIEACGELAAPTDSGAWVLGWLEFEGFDHGLTDEELWWRVGEPPVRLRSWDQPLNVTLLWRVLTLEVATARCPRESVYNALARVHPGDVPWLESASLSMGPPSSYDGEFYVTMLAKTARHQIDWFWEFYPMHQYGSRASITLRDVAG